MVNTQQSPESAGGRTIQPTRFKLVNVPAVGQKGKVQPGGAEPRCPENSPIPAVIRAVMEYRGEGLGCHKQGQDGSTGCGELACAYAYGMGVSGAAFYTCWDDHWLDDCVSIIYLGHDFETAEKRIFNALGYPYQWIMPKEGQETRTAWLGLIKTSLQERNMPVLSYGVIGPPEPAIITGWDEGGEVLLGWSFFQDFPEFNAGVSFEPDGQFRKKNWLEGNLCLLLIGDKGPRPEPRQVYREALAWALQVGRTAKVFPESDAPAWVATKWNGLAALHAWQTSLCDCNSFMDDEALLRHHHAMHSGVAANLAEERRMAILFLQQAAGHCPKASKMLDSAGRLYQEETNLVDQLFHLCPGREDPQAFRKMADQGVRSALAAVIAAMQAKEEQALAKLEQALAIWDEAQ